MSVLTSRSIVSRRWAVAALLVAAGCTEPHYTSGSLKCAVSGRACPSDFYCAVDGRCWQNGVFPDLSATPSDLGAVELGADLSSRDLPAIDLTAVDLAGLDLAGRDLTTFDMATAIDLSHLDLASHDLASNVSLCSGLSVKLCDGFEGALNARWTNDINNGTISIDTSRAYRGASSLHLHTNAEPTANTEPQANVYTMAALPISTTIYVRAWAYFPSTIPGDFDQLLNFSNAGGAGISYSAAGGHPILNDYGTPAIYNQSTLFTIPTNRWTCLQMEIPQPVSMMGIVRLFLDGAEVTDVTTASTGTAPTMDHVYLGLDWYGNPASFPATDLWLDELIIDNNPTTCAE